MGNTMHGSMGAHATLPVPEDSCLAFPADPGSGHRIPEAVKSVVLVDTCAASAACFSFSAPSYNTDLRQQKLSQT